ncbi:histone deacetylase [Pontibacter sp. BT310]|uniref:Histone deacetylase n=1 Tax=Pontibacter populi TaxID=890055 RepID=A0ABS6X8B1_9BACT|nr:MULTISPECIES: histone deacetylase [Pontibacter]MBJ6117372.1 histone deacetylase [Pontibacter sp. BT310]MBR0569797.1 histone deacetylase [Microvirga sp. STS03]MBW3364225.1 histone deacetylase [Pontibacter populi]
MLKIAWSRMFAHALPEGHRFPMAKYDLLPEQLLYEGTITEANLFAPEPLPEKFIVDTHDSDYWHRLRQLQLTPSEIRKTGFPLSDELVDREVVIMNGTVQAALFALEFGIGMNIAGGTHHAFTDRGEGFCLLNDIAIAARYLLNYKSITKVLVIDLDVHQGNGTAQIFASEPRVFTFSMHCGHNYPFHKEQSDLDIPLAEGTDDKTYLHQLQTILPRLLDKVEPEFVFFQSGVDVLATDKLGKLGMTIAGCKERDRTVLELCRRNNLPVAVSMGGGYSRQIAHIVEAHANTFRLAQQLWF